MLKVVDILQLCSLRRGRRERIQFVFLLPEAAA